MSFDLWCDAFTERASVHTRQVLGTSRGDYTAAAAGLGAAFTQDMDDFCESHPDVVILATSITSTEAVLRGMPLQRLRRSTLFVDVLSVKEFPRRLLLSLLPPQVTFQPSRRCIWGCLQGWAIFLSRTPRHVNALLASS